MPKVILTKILSQKSWSSKNSYPKYALGLLNKKRFFLAHFFRKPKRNEKVEKRKRQKSLKAELSSRSAMESDCPFKDHHL